MAHPRMWNAEYPDDSNDVADSVSKKARRSLPALPVH